MSNWEQQYTIIQKLGAGGMGTVYLAKDKLLDRDVAIKQLNQPVSLSEEAISARFQQEALALAKLNHPNITHLYSFHPSDDRWCMVMEYVTGKTLEEWMRVHKKISHPLAVSIVVQLLQGLQHAHKKGIIHRDIKPANIMINDEGQVKIMDFGIARMRNVQRLTNHGKSVGTLDYMAPEQIQGQEGDDRTDIYAVGTILYEMLCGRAPFVAETEYQLMKDKLEKNPSPITNYNNQVPPALQKLIFKTLEKNPNKRPLNVTVFKESLEQISNKEVLPQQQLSSVLKAAQVITTPSKSSEILSVQHILDRAKKISGSFNTSVLKKVNKPIALLVASVLICIILLLWNSSANNEPSSEIQSNPALLNTATITEPIKDSVATHPSQSSINETPAQLYQRLQQQPETTDKEPEKEKIPSPENKKKVKVTNPESPDKKSSPPVVPKEKESSVSDPEPLQGRSRNSYANKSLRAVLNETISSEDISRDGSQIRLTAANDVEIDGKILIRKGAAITGKIVDVVPTGNKRKKAVIGFVIQQAKATDGSAVKLRSQRFRLFASNFGEAVAFKNGETFPVELGRIHTR